MEMKLSSESLHKNKQILFMFSCSWLPNYCTLGEVFVSSFNNAINTAGSASAAVPNYLCEFSNFGAIF